jgi:hypothetical protein
VGENNLFVTGWIKRGSTGIIGTNVLDAKETVALLVEYIKSGGIDVWQLLPNDDACQHLASYTGRVRLAEIL